MSARLRMVAWRKVNPEKARHQTLVSNLRTNYGITLEEYDALVVEQKGKCAICNNGCSTGTRLSVDHCHTTGKIRGLLCRRCNAGLGNFNDDLSQLEAAVNYLRTHNV